MTTEEIEKTRRALDETFSKLQEQIIQNNELLKARIDGLTKGIQECNDRVVRIEDIIKLMGK